MVYRYRRTYLQHCPSTRQHHKEGREPYLLLEGVQVARCPVPGVHSPTVDRSVHVSIPPSPPGGADIRNKIAPRLRRQSGRINNRCGAQIQGGERDESCDLIFLAYSDYY